MGEGREGQDEGGERGAGHMEEMGGMGKSGRRERVGCKRELC